MIATLLNLLIATQDLIEPDNKKMLEIIENITSADFDIYNFKKMYGEYDLDYNYGYSMTHEVFSPLTAAIERQELGRQDRNEIIDFIMQRKVVSLNKKNIDFSNESEVEKAMDQIFKNDSEATSQISDQQIRNALLKSLDRINITDDIKNAFAKAINRIFRWSKEEETEEYKEQE